MKSTRILIAFLSALVFHFANAADTPTPSPLRIGTSASYAPLTFKEAGKFQGVEIDLARAVGENLKVKIEIVETPWEALIPALNDKKIDVIMSGMSITDARSKRVLFTESYMTIGQMALIRSADLVEWSRPTALLRKGVRIGVKAGTTGEAFASSEFRNADITGFSTIEAGTDALVAKDIDIFIHDAPTIWRLSASTATQKAGLMGLYRPLTDEHLAWAVRLEDKELADALNQSLEALKNNGTLGRVMGKWIPIQVKVRK